jgi:hypothetical protein
MMCRTIGLLVTLALGLLVAPLVPEAQPPKHVYRIGWLVGTTPGRGPGVEAFLEEMRALGYVEGQHFVIERRGAEGQYERFPALAAEGVPHGFENICRAKRFGKPPHRSGPNGWQVPSTRITAGRCSEISMSHGRADPSKPARLIMELADTRTRVMPPLPCEYTGASTPQAIRFPLGKHLFAVEYAAGATDPREAHGASAC